MNVHKTYDKSDNDTYVEKLGITPYQDVHLHMFRDPDGFVTIDNIRGNFTADSIRDAENHVLQFPTAADCGLVKIREIKAVTFYPMSLVERHDLSIDDLSYIQRLPVYFDEKNHVHVLFMDARFLRDLNYIELRQYLEKGQYYNSIHQYVSTRGAKTYLGISFAEVSDIKLASDMFHDPSHKSPLRTLYDAYVKYKLSSELREKVILIKYANIPGRRSLFNAMNSGEDELDSVTTQFQMEYSLGYRVGDRYHLADENGDICLDRALKVDRADPSFLIIPYSMDQMRIVKDIEAALGDFRMRVMDYLTQGKSADQPMDNCLIDDDVLVDLLRSKS